MREEASGCATFAKSQALTSFVCGCKGREGAAMLNVRMTSV